MIDRYRRNKMITRNMGMHGNVSATNKKTQCYRFWWVLLLQLGLWSVPSVFFATSVSFCHQIVCDAFSMILYSQLTELRTNIDYCATKQAVIALSRNGKKGNKRLGTFFFTKMSIGLSALRRVSLPLDIKNRVLRVRWSLTTPKSHKVKEYGNKRCLP